MRFVGRVTGYRMAKRPLFLFLLGKQSRMIPVQGAVALHATIRAKVFNFQFVQAGSAIPDNYDRFLSHRQKMSDDGHKYSDTKKLIK